jgi:tetratricopeptide (TPR) repeat protein
MTVQEYLERASKYVDKRKYDKAITDYIKVIELEPDIPSVYGLRGMTYSNKKKFDLAIADFTEAIRLEPDNGDFYIERAGAYTFSLGNKNLIIADFEKFLELAPNDENAEENREILKGLKSGKMSLFKNRIIDIDEELKKRSIPIIIFNFIPFIPLGKAFVWLWSGIWNGPYWEPAGLKDDFKYIANKETWMLGDGIPVLQWILFIPKVIANIPEDGGWFWRFLYVFFRLWLFWTPLLAILILASPIVGIIRGIIFLTQRGKIKELAV